MIVHRVGALPRNAQIVFVAAASAHRGDAFRGCEYIIDALKTRAPFWKRETLADGGSFWVEQRQSDQDRTQSWDEKAPTPHATRLLPPEGAVFASGRPSGKKSSTTKKEHP